MSRGDTLFITFVNQVNIYTKMNKVLFIIFLFISILGYAQDSAELQQEIVNLKIENQNQNIAAQHKIATQAITAQNKYINIQIKKLDERVADMQHQQNLYLAVISIIIALGGIIGFTKIRHNTKDARKIKKEIEEESVKVKEESTAFLSELKELKAKSLQELDAIQAMRDDIETMKKGFDSLIKTKREEIEKIIKEQKDKADSLTTEQKNKIEEYSNLVNILKTETEKTSTDWYIKGLTASLNKDSLRAVEYYEKATKVDPNNSYAYINWGGELVELGRYNEAIEICQKANKLIPDDAHNYNNLGFALNGLDRYEEAKEILDKAIELKIKNNSEDANTYRHLAVSYLGLSEIEKVIPALEKAESLNPEYIKTYGTWDEALVELKETNSPRYADERDKFKEILKKNKDLEGLKDNTEFQKIYKKYLGKSKE